MLPPTTPMTVFFSERLLASKIGKSTQASCVVMLIGRVSVRSVMAHTQYDTRAR